MAIALTIASSVGQYAMAGSTLVTTPNGAAYITANNGGKFKAGTMTNYISNIEADTGSTVIIDKAVASIGYNNKAFHLAVKVAVLLLLRKAFMMLKK